MNDNYLRKFKYKLIFQIILRIMLCLIALFVLIYLIDGVFNDLLANTAAGISRSLYLFFVNNKQEILFVLFALIVIATVFMSISKAMKYLNAIVRSIGKVFQKDEELIVLPDDFKDIENKLNSIKYEALRNEQIAREAEQRKNDLVVYLAHDLKTPLTSVIGYLTLLNSEKTLSPDLREKYLAISLDKAQRLEELINEFFEITRFNLQNIVLEIGTLNLGVMLGQLADEFYPLLSEKQITCSVHVPENLIIRGDADKLARVFDNVLRNAINYGDPNSTLYIYAETQEEGVRIRFINEGDPIPQEKLDLIFEKFYRLDSARSSKTGGAGLGLAIAKEIVTLPPWNNFCFFW